MSISVPVQSVFVPVDTALGQMISQLQSGGSLITDLIEGSIARTILEAVAVLDSNTTAVADQLQFDSYLSTATGPALDALATNWFVPRLPAVQASGELTVTRQDTTDALLLQAGWGQLATTASIPGTAGVSIVTTSDANFAAGQATATIPAQAVLGGSDGNLSAGTYLTPLAPVAGISSQNGFQVAAAFTGGVDVETDTAYRARIPIVVQGRQLLGTLLAFQGAAMSVAGVIGVAVLTPGSTRGDDSTVPAGSVEVYYRGSDGLLLAVQSAVANAATLGQNASAFASIDLELGLLLPGTFAAGGAGITFQWRGQMETVVGMTVYVNPGIDVSATEAAIEAAVLGYFAGLSVGQTAYYSEVVNLVHGVSQVVSVELPLTDFRVESNPPGTVSDIVPLDDSYLDLIGSNLTIIVLTLPG